MKQIFFVANLSFYFVCFIEFKYFLKLCDLLHVKMDISDVRGHIFMKLFPTIYYSKIGTSIMTLVKHR